MASIEPLLFSVTRVSTFAGERLLTAASGFFFERDARLFLVTSRHVVMQHLGVLREADLVLVEPRGRKRVNHLNPVPIQQIHQRWVSHYEENWAVALVGLKLTVESAEQEDEDVG